jgi:hypothetical protein
MDAPKILTNREMVTETLRESAIYVEFCGPGVYDRGSSFKYSILEKAPDFITHRPTRFHPGVADKFLFRILIEDKLNRVPERIWDSDDAKGLSASIMVNDFYTRFYNPGEDEQYHQVCKDNRFHFYKIAKGVRTTDIFRYIMKLRKSGAKIPLEI